MIKYIEGDLFDHIPDSPTIITHIVNSKGAWGRGFVIPLAQKFPVAKQAYLDWCVTGSNANIPFQLGQTQIVQVSPQLCVANMLAQTLGGKRPLYYNHLARCMDVVRLQSHFDNFEILAPLFGAGLAGGNWEFIEELIEDCWIRNGLSVTVCYLTQFLPPNWTPS